MDIVKWSQLAAICEASLNLIQWILLQVTRGQGLKSEVQQSALFTVRVCALRRRGLDTGHTGGPNLGQKLADKYSIPAPALSGRFITQKQSWVKCCIPNHPVRPQRQGPGGNAGAVST